jgi:hypothetical protein
LKKRQLIHLNRLIKIDINENRIFPDIAMRDPDHLRRPGWVEEYGRILKQVIKKLSNN